MAMKKRFLEVSCVKNKKVKRLADKLVRGFTKPKLFTSFLPTFFCTGIERQTIDTYHYSNYYAYSSSPPLLDTPTNQITDNLSAYIYR